MCELPGEATIEPGVTVALILFPEPADVASSGEFWDEQADNRIAAIISIGLRIFIKRSPPWANQIGCFPRVDD
jgi:hypothetical protein